MKSYFCRLSLLLLLTPAAATLAASPVVDRLALVVGKAIFTQSEVEDEVRLNELENGKPLDLSPARRKEAAERMVDQQLLRDEILVTGFKPPVTTGEALLSQFCKEHFGALSQCRSAVARYGVTEEALKLHLLWELTALRFTDQRFRPVPAAVDAPGAPATGNAADADAASTDQQMETWLKQRRTDTRIVFKQEAFQ